MIKAPALTFHPVLSRAHASDVACLHALHYRAGLPRAVAGIWSAHIAGTLAGALWVTFPVLNDGWRNAAWRDIPIAPTQRVAWLNANVRTISRVIVDPRFRACGIATALVRHYLAAPLTPKTEALAAMGNVSPFFERAGMRRVPRTLSTRDAYIAKCLHESKVPPWQLADARKAHALLHRSPRLRDAILRWARSGKATAQFATHTNPHVLVQLAMLASASVSTPAIAYVYEQV